MASQLLRIPFCSWQMFSARSTTLYGIGLRLLTSGEDISHHLRRVRHISATIWRYIEQFETICDEFGTFETSFETILRRRWTICDDWRRWEAKSDCLWADSIYFRTLCASFESIWGIRGAIQAFGDEIWTFAVDLWRLRRVEMIAGIQSQSYTTIIGSQYDCYIAIVDQLQAKWHWFELITAICGELRLLDDDGSEFEGCRKWKVSAAMSSAPFCGGGRRNLGDESKNVRRKHCIWIKIIIGKWENGGRGEILYIRSDTWMSKIWRGLKKNK